MGVEAFAEVASLLCPDGVVTGLRDVEFLRPFKFHRMQPATLHLAAAGRPGEGGEVLVEVTLSSRLQPKGDVPAQERLHFRGQVVVAAAAPPAPRSELRLTPEPTFGRDAIYGVYFHGPAYRVLDGVTVEQGEAIGALHRELPANARDAGAVELVAPRLVEACFQTAGVIDLAERSLMALPARVDALRVYRAAPAGAALYALVHRRPGDDGFDARIVDATGGVVLELAGYRTVALPERRSLAQRREAAGEGVPA
jgi:hypothetical protein